MTFGLLTSARHLIARPSVWVRLLFSYDSFELVHLKQDPRGSDVRRHMTYLLTGDTHLVAWLRRCLPRFSSVKLLLFLLQ